MITFKIEVYAHNSEDQTLSHLDTQDISVSELRDRDFVKATIYHVAFKYNHHDAGTIYYANIVDPCDPDGVYGEVYDCFLRWENDDIVEGPAPGSFDDDYFFQARKFFVVAVADDGQEETVDETHSLFRAKMRAKTLSGGKYIVSRRGDVITDI